VFCNGIPVPKAVELDPLEKRQLLLCSPAGVEEREVHALEDLALVLGQVRLNCAVGSKAQRAQVKVWTHCAFVLLFVGDVALTHVAVIQLGHLSSVVPRRHCVYA